MDVGLSDKVERGKKEIVGRKSSMYKSMEVNGGWTMEDHGIK